jgi:calpain, invertebrate
MPLTQD